MLKIKGLLLKNTKRNKDELLKKSKKVLTMNDLEKAEQSILAYEQRQHFKQEMDLIKQGKYCQKNSPIYKMDPILDQTSLLRVGGRINKLSMPTETNAGCGWRTEDGRSSTGPCVARHATIQLSGDGLLWTI